MSGTTPGSRDDGAIAFEVAPVRRPRRRMDPVWLAVAVVVILVGVAVLQPWAGGPPGLRAVVPPSPTLALPSTIAGIEPTPSPSGVPTIVAARSAASRVIRDPGGEQDRWGVAIGAGASPEGGPTFDVNTQVPVISISLDGSWSAWAPVQPTPQPYEPLSTADPLAGIAIAQLCTGLPDLPSGAQVVAITAPGGPRDFLAIRGWQGVGWRDERSVEPLASTDQLTSFNSGAIEYLEQPAGQAWPDGRYEFRMTRSVDSVVTVCLGRP